MLDVGAWWDPEHTYSGDSRNLSLDARAGGCFCERVGDGGVEHARVVYVAPGRTLRLAGSLGPLQAHGTAGSLTWSVAEREGNTVITWTYGVGGFVAGGFDRLAPAVDRVIGEQFERLRRYAETGRAKAE